MVAPGKYEISLKEWPTVKYGNAECDKKHCTRPAAFTVSSGLCTMPALVLCEYHTLGLVAG